jgi:hypothetical protein
MAREGRTLVLATATMLATALYFSLQPLVGGDTDPQAFAFVVAGLAGGVVGLVVAALLGPTEEDRPPR